MGGLESDSIRQYRAQPLGSRARSITEHMGGSEGVHLMMKVLTSSASPVMGVDV
jgi:hypothetical protein